ncbi:MAG: DUF2800 domain-containing protein [Pseudomonadales bacterium]
MTTISIRSSASHRRLNCPASFNLEEAAPDQPDSDEAKEGTAAHSMAEMMLTDQVSDIVELIDRQAPNGVVYVEEMVEPVMMYVGHIKDRGVPFHVEKEINFKNGNIHVTGTADCVAYDEQTATLYVDDFKYGHRHVDQFENWQLLCYAFGMIEAMELQEKVKTIVMSIIQPRSYHPGGPIRSWTINITEMAHWHRKMWELGQRLLVAEPLAITGNQCHYCTAYGQCPAAQASGMNAVDVALKGFTDELTNDALAMEMKSLDRAKNVLKNRVNAIEDLIKARLRLGRSVPGYGMVETFGHRQWVKTVDVTMLETIAGTCLSEPKLITPAAAERAGVSKVMVKSFTEKPSSGFKLTEVDLDRMAKGIFDAN